MPLVEPPLSSNSDNTVGAQTVEEPAPDLAFPDRPRPDMPYVEVARSTSATPIERSIASLRAEQAAVHAQTGPSFLDVAAAAERQTNVVSMAYDKFYANPKPSAPPVPGYDPVASIPEGYEAYGERFLDAENPQQVAWIKGRIDQELNDRQVLGRAGIGGFASTLVAGLTDPITLASMAIPVAGEAMVGGRLAQAGRLALISGGTSAAQEVAAHQLSETRTAGESLFNIGASVVLGGVLGAAIRPRVPRPVMEKLNADPDAALGVPAPVNPTGESTAGAAQVARPTLEQNTIATGGRTIASTIGQVAPGPRLLTSPSNEARTLVQELTEGREILEKNTEGVASPIALETDLRRYEGDWYQGWKARQEAFRDYRERVANTDAAPLSRSEFGQAVAEAMRRGDEHEIPEVAQAAKDTRRIVFEPLKARAQKLGLLSEDVQASGADSYLMRQYDVRKIRANFGQWINTLAEGFKAQGTDPAEALDAAYEATRNVLGSERGTMDWKVRETVPESGRFKERALTLPDKVLEPFLNNDIDHLSHSYLRSMAPEVEFTERFGSRDMKDQLDAVRDEYTRLMEQARASGDTAKMASLEASQKADLSDLVGIRDRLYGIYGQPKDPSAWSIRAMRFARSFNAVRMLGMAGFSHLPDMGNVITRYGLGNTFSALGKMLTSLDAIKLTQAEARRIGVGLDMVQNTTAALLGDYGSHSRFLEQRVMQKLTRGFTIATGETPLITMIQSLASAMGQHELVSLAERAASGEALPGRAAAVLALRGIDGPMLERIAGQAAEHGQEVNGLKFGMSDQWQDKAAARAFELAILRDAHAMTLSPGASDTPLFMSTELGKMLLQFQSFAFAASRHVLQPVAQGIASGDARSASGLFSLLTAGALSYYLKQKIAGQPIETNNPGRLAADVLDKSNLAGWTGSVVFPALWQLGFKDLSRWSDRDAVETALGPTAGTLASIYDRRLPSKLVGNAEHPFSRSDLHFLRRLMPAQNLWYFRRAANGLEDWVADRFDLPGKSNAERAAEDETRAAAAQ